MLAALLRAGEDDVVLVVSQPDRPKGRGQKLEPTPTKAEAEAHGVRVLQPTKLKDGVLAAELRSLELDLAIVVAYGRILPKDVFEAPRAHSWNVHASLLPRHRGASPIQHAILEGDATTGVCLMIVGEGLDEGDVLLSRSLPLRGTETTGTLTPALADLGAALLLDGLRQSKREGLPRIPQDPAGVTHAPLLEKADGQLDLRQPAIALDRRIRAVDPWPGASIPGPGGPLKILSAQAIPAEHPTAPGMVVQTQPHLVLGTGEGWLKVTQLQPAGKRPMAAADFFRGGGREIRIGEPWPHVLMS